MEQLKQIKSTIRTVQNIAKVTKTMQMISATRMKKAIKRFEDAAPYYESMNEIMKKIGKIDDYAHPFLRTTTEPKKIAIVIIGPTKGFVGSLITNLAIAINHNMKELQDAYPDTPIVSITINKLGLKVSKICGLQNEYHFSKNYDIASYADLVPIFQAIKERFTTGALDLIYISYLNFLGVSSQKPMFIPLLPSNLKDSNQNNDLGNNNLTNQTGELIEPNPTLVMDFLLEEFFEKQIYFGILASGASEHSVRMVSMQNATNNANNLASSLSLRYNKGRQAQITQQILEVSVGI